MAQTLISNEAFLMQLAQHPNKAQNVYTFQMLPVDAQQEHLDLLQNSLSMICTNALCKSTIILDCSLLKQKSLVKQSCLKKIIGIDNPTGLDKFIIVTTCTLISVLSKGIIKLKRADSYTKICASIEEAWQIL